MKEATNKIGFRPTWAEINLTNLTHNFKQLKKLFSPEIKMMVCVKADAYGHGLITTSTKLAALGVDYLAVASIDEGISLRQNYIKVPVLVLGMILEDHIRPLFKYNLIPAVPSESLALALNKEACRKGKPVKVHLKIDTGMGRLGVLAKNAPSFIKKINKLKFIDIEGIFTHLACADSNMYVTSDQIRIFNRLITELNKEKINIKLIHAANSMGVIGYKKSHFNMVRPGLAIYGLYPKQGLKIKLKPVLSLKTRVVYSKRVPCGYGISYGHTYKTSKASTILTLPIGYGDGYPRILSNKAPVLIRGRRYKVSGRVCMDHIMVDVGNHKFPIGEEVVLIGSQGKEKISAAELAYLGNTISYEIVCGIGSRVPRIYSN
ncbi:MAG: alanine racemase [Candidatus Omnitrophota bacterium]|nr:MAG: alanine racemase [Candidatus Omnitrophota bacterium]